MFSDPPHNLAVAALIAATLHNPATRCLVSRNMLVSKKGLLPLAAASVMPNDTGWW